MNNWSEVLLKDICDITRGASPRPIHDFMTEDLDGIPWVKIKDATASNTRFIKNTKGFIKKEGKNKSVSVISGDLIVSNSATPGLPKIMGIDACIHDGWLLLRNLNGVCKEFLFYLLINDRKQIVSQGTGTVFTNLKTDILKNHQIKLPPISEQEEIASFLGLVDDKIELNQKMNETLEEIAKTLFKSWFIDFDPVRAKAEGRSTGLSKEISNLFPDSFEDSELGEIPKGWKVGSLNDIIVRSKDKIKDTNSRVLAAVSSGELVLSEEYFSKQVFSKDISKYIKVEQYDFAYNPSRINIGSIGMNEYDFIGAVSPVYIVFKPFTHWHLFISQFIRLKSTNSKINQLSSGSVRQSLSFDDFASIPITIPTDVANMKFNEIYELLRRKIIQNQEECGILTSLRDTLLPKLISGELQIPDAKNLVEETGV